MPCYLWSALVLVLAWLAVFFVFRGLAANDKKDGVTVADVLALVLTVPGCMGCYPLWPLAVLVMMLLVVARVSTRSEATGVDWKRALLRAGLCGGLFLLAWHQCATVKRAALYGFGERLEAYVDSEKLLTWATDVIAARKQAKEEDPRLKREQIPDFVHDLMGGIPDNTRVEVRLQRDDDYVSVFNSAQMALQIIIRPSRAVQERGPFPPAWIVGDTAGLQWRPGIFLDTVGNFR